MSDTEKPKPYTMVLVNSISIINREPSNPAHSRLFFIGGDHDSYLTVPYSLESLHAMLKGGLSVLALTEEELDND